MSHFRFVGLLLIAALMLVSAENALTPEEIQILTQNDYTITVNEEDSTITYAHHGLPEHTSSGGWGNPNDAEMVNHSYTVPLKPTVADVKGCAGGLGVIGLAISGGAFYNPYTAFGYDAVNGTCAEELDDCKGHPSQDGTYHYHGIPECLYKSTGDLRDKFLGVALDGYPIYGPMDNSSKTWKSADLDECHGHYYNGRYMYRATYDFPYIISCFHGNSAKRVQGPRPGGQGPPMRTRRHATPTKSIEGKHLSLQVGKTIHVGMQNMTTGVARYVTWFVKTLVRSWKTAKKKIPVLRPPHIHLLCFFLALAYALRILL